MEKIFIKLENLLKNNNCFRRRNGKIKFLKQLTLKYTLLCFFVLMLIKYQNTALIYLLLLENNNKYIYFSNYRFFFFLQWWRKTVKIF